MNVADLGRRRHFEEQLQKISHLEQRLTMTSEGNGQVVVDPKVESTGWYRTSLDMPSELVKQEISVHIRIFSPSSTTTPDCFHVVARHL